MLRLLLTLSLLMKQSERTCSVLKRSAGLLAWLAIQLNGYSPFFCPIFSKVNGYAPFFNRVLWIFLAFLTLFIPCFLGGYAPFYTEGTTQCRVIFFLAFRKRNRQEGANFICAQWLDLSLIHISEPTRLLSISYAVFCLKKKKKKINHDTITTRQMYNRHKYA